MRFRGCLKAIKWRYVGISSKLCASKNRFVGPESCAWKDIVRTSDKVELFLKVMYYLVASEYS